MDPVAFEEMCCAILQTHPHIESAVRYGVNGQSQKGIDILAKHKAEGHDVAQCKCHKSFDEKKIDSAVSEFLKHVGFWKDYGTKTFILLVASSLSNPTRRFQIPASNGPLTGMNANTEAIRCEATVKGKYWI